MKTSKLGLPGSVTVIGLIYVLALALAPTPGMSAPGDQTGNGLSTQVRGPETVTGNCPHVRYVVETLAGAHRAPKQRPWEMPSMPAWGTGRLTVF